MKTLEIYNLYTEFINNVKYKNYFLSNEDEWKQNLNNVKQYINKNNKKPSTHDKNKDIKYLGSWIRTQQQNYKTKLQIMATPEIYNSWTELINHDTYKKYFNYL